MIEFNETKEVSNAVLTPHLNHPSFMRKEGIARVTRYTRPADLDPVSDVIKQQRKVWCERQAEVIKGLPSNAILGTNYDN